MRALDSSRSAPSRRQAVLKGPLSPYTLLEGSLLPAILTAGIHSDLPGQTTALIRANVYDSVTGRHLLVPTGTRPVLPRRGPDSACRHRSSTPEGSRHPVPIHQRVGRPAPWSMSEKGDF